MTQFFSTLLLGTLLGTLLLHSTTASTPKCKVYLDRDESRFVDLNVLAKDDFYGPIAYNASNIYDWHYYINICAPVRRECWSSADYFSRGFNEERWVMHDDYGAIQVQNSKLEDKEHIDCNFIATRLTDENEIYVSAKVTNAELLHFSVVYEKGENLTWYGEEYNRKTIINIRCNRNLPEGTTVVSDRVQESSAPPGVYTFEVESRDVCEVHTDHHWPLLFPVGLLGLLFLLLCTGFVLYWPIGALVNVLRKKRGVEIIPNYGFWKSLPMLFVDGITWPLVICGIGRRAPGSLEAEQDIFDEA